MLAILGPFAHASIDSLWSSPMSAGAKGQLTAPGLDATVDYLYALDSAAGVCRIYDPDGFAQLYSFPVSGINSYTYLWYLYIPDANANGHPEAVVYRYSLATYCYSVSIVDMSAGSVLKSWSSASYSYFPKFIAATPGSATLKFGLEKSTGQAGGAPSCLLVYSLGITAAVAGPGPGAARAPGIELEQSFPNPSHDRAVIDFTLPVAGRTSVTVYNQIGQAVRTLVDGQLAAGKHRIPFDGRGLPNGAYFYRLATPDGAEVRKLLLVR
jgi:hypothetical protein